MPEEEREGFTSEPRMPEVAIPFPRWLIKLIVEKLMAPVLIPMATAAATAATGWYVVGQYQVSNQVTREVKTQDKVRSMVGNYLEDVQGAAGTEDQPVELDMAEAMAEIKTRWDSQAKPALGEEEPALDFPEEDVMNRLQQEQTQRKR